MVCMDIFVSLLMLTRCHNSDLYFCVRRAEQGVKVVPVLSQPGDAYTGRRGYIQVRSHTSH